MNKRGFKKILLAVLGAAAFIYEFATLVPDRVIYINGAGSALPEFVSGSRTETGTEKLTFFGVVPYKTVSVDVVSGEKVILGGESVGVNIDVDGVTVLGVSDFYGEDGKKHCPAADAGILAEDIITEINGEKIVSAESFSQITDRYSQGTMNVKLMRGKKTESVTLKPIKSAEDGKFHLGLWVRDGTVGIGTLTFVDPKTKTFGALGHSVNDAKTGETVNTGRGSICYSSITGIKTASGGLSGELEGVFVSDAIGDIRENGDFGIFGNFFGDIDFNRAVSVASRNEIREGKAVVLCCVDGNKIQSFDIRVEKINLNSDSNKSMVIKVTDPNLIEKTGGIVRGMSGSPIIQNGKLIGAVTHVFVNDPTMGYGVFIENMLAEAAK